MPYVAQLTRGEAEKHVVLSCGGLKRRGARQIAGQIEREEGAGCRGAVDVVTVDVETAAGAAGCQRLARQRAGDHLGRRGGVPRGHTPRNVDELVARREGGLASGRGHVDVRRVGRCGDEGSGQDDPADQCQKFEPSRSHALGGE